jgi:hypothetical protein
MSSKDIKMNYVIRMLEEKQAVRKEREEGDCLSLDYTLEISFDGTCIDALFFLCLIPHMASRRRDLKSGFSWFMIFSGILTTV